MKLEKAVGNQLQLHTKASSAKQEWRTLLYDRQVLDAKSRAWLSALARKMAQERESRHSDSTAIMISVSASNPVRPCTAEEGIQASNHKS